MPDKTSELINSSSTLLSGNDKSLHEKNVFDVAKCSENLNVSSSHLTVSSKDEHIVTLPPADNSLYRDSTSVKTKSKEIKQECDEKELETRGSSNPCMPDLQLNVSNEQQKLCEPGTKEIVQQPSFSSLQDEYFHEMITRIGTDVDNDKYVQDISTLSESSDRDRIICVMAPYPTKGGTDCVLDIDQTKLNTPQVSPHEKSAWSSTSSISTRPNTDNPSSMSNVITRFGAPRKNQRANAADDMCEHRPSQLQNDTTDSGNQSYSKDSFLSPHVKISENSSKKTDAKTFKSTAV